MTERDRDDREQTASGATQRTGAEGDQRTARDQGDGFGQTRGPSGDMSRSAAGGTTGDDRADANAREGVSDRGGTGGYGASSGYASGSEATDASASSRREPSVREDAPIDEERFDTRKLGTREPPGEMPSAMPERGQQPEDGGTRGTE